jgi:hypothetical protein
MRSTAILYHILALLFIGGPASALPGRIVQSAEPRRTAREMRRFLLAPGQTRVELGRSFIIPGSDSVTLDGLPLVRGDQYRINELKGTIVLVQKAEGGELLVVGYSRYPMPFPPVFTSRLPEGAPALPSVFLQPGMQERRAPEKKRFRLRLSGSKTVGASAGTGRGLGIEQSLKVSIAGKIAEDLEVSAFLTDDDLRVQPEGNTEELRHLEKVYVQVKSRHSEVQLGDFTTGLDWSSFSFFQRELRGATARLALGDRVLLAGGGLAKGRFKSVTFFGREGVQGPYELLSARRFNSVVILPGSETVYFDGRVLGRGAENGYTIDYNRGTLTFTERVPVTDDSEIVVDFQVGEDNYERTSLVGGIISPVLSPHIELRALYFREADDSGKPVAGELSEEDREALAAAGDDPSLAFTSGVHEVAEGEGDYVLVPADTVPEHFEFIESGGNYRLDFHEVGSGKGDYAPDGFSTRGQVKFGYVGEGMGDYVIGRSLALPERKQLISLDLRAERGWLFARAEGNLSLHDKNALSARDDGDNIGSAVKVEGGLKGIRTLGSKLSLIGTFSTLDDRFAPPDKPRRSYFYRNWNLDDVPLEGKERIGGFSIALEGERRWGLRGGFEHLSRDTLTAQKSEIEATLGDFAERGLSFRALDSRAGSERNRRFFRGEGSFSLWHLVPTASYESERYRSYISAAQDTGRYYRQGAVGVRSKETGPFSGSLVFSRRLTDRLSGDGAKWLDARENDEIRVATSYSRAGRVVDLLFTHRKTTDEQTGVSSTNDLARVRFRDTWESIGLAHDVSYRITSGEERRREKTVIYVGENQGDYDSEGREVGQKRGDYMILYLPGEESEPMRTVELSWRLSIGSGVRGLRSGSGDAGWLGRLRRNVSSDNIFSVVEQSRTDDALGLYTLSPSTLQRDDVTLYGVIKLRSEWNLLNNVKKANLRLIYTREDEEDNRSLGIQAERFRRSVVARTEVVPLASLTISLEGGTGLRLRQSAALFEQDYRVESIFASHTLNYRLRPSTRLTLELGLEKRRDEISSAEQISYKAAPSLTASVGKEINLTSFVRFTYTDSRADEGKPLFFLEEGWRQDWSIIGNYRITKRVSFGMNYTGRREKGFLGEVETIHDFKLESRAYF